MGTPPTFSTAARERVTPQPRRSRAEPGQNVEAPGARPPPRCPVPRCKAAVEAARWGSVAIPEKRAGAVAWAQTKAQDWIPDSLGRRGLALLAGTVAIATSADAAAGYWAGSRAVGAAPDSAPALRAELDGVGERLAALERA